MHTCEVRGTQQLCVTLFPTNQLRSRASPCGHCPFTLLTLLPASHPQVASYMRGVLRTLAVMHSHHILHRDIKPSNFMLLNDSERAPLKAIDFGLAMPYEPEALPLSHLGLEGTPW